MLAGVRLSLRRAANAVFDNFCRVKLRPAIRANPAFATSGSLRAAWCALLGAFGRLRVLRPVCGVPLHSGAIRRRGLRVRHFVPLGYGFPLFLRAFCLRRCGGVLCGRCRRGRTFPFPRGLDGNCPGQVIFLKGDVLVLRRQARQFVGGRKVDAVRFQFLREFRGQMANDGVISSDLRCTGMKHLCDKIAGPVRL